MTNPALDHPTSPNPREQEVTMREPPSEDAQRCIRLRKGCKAGKIERLHPDDARFIEKMFKNYPDWYAATERRVRDETLPFGARK